MSSIEYRNLCISDIEENKYELAELMLITLKDNIHQSFPDSLASEYISKMPTYISDNTAIIIGAFKDGVLVGFIWGYVTRVFNEDRVHSYMGAVNPLYRGQHIAQKLMELQFEEAKKRGIFVLEAMVTASNTAAYNWHIRSGFVEERIKMVCVLEKYENNGDCCDNKECYK